MKSLNGISTTVAFILMVGVIGAVLGLIASSAPITSVAHAATITVDSTANTVADDGLCTLREAITAANTDSASGATPGECPAGSGSDTIELGVSLNYILEVVDNSTAGDNGLPAITSQITIHGNGSTIERDALAPDFRIVHVEVGGNLTLNNMTITGGAASGGGGIDNRGTLTITDGAVSGNSASSDGGGIQNNGTLNITNSSLGGNTATRFGGGIINSLSAVSTVTNSTLMGNSAGLGGGIFNSISGAATITDGTLSGNTATSNGGGIHNSGTMTIKNSNLSGNSANGLLFREGGGGIQNNSTMTITNSTLTGNTAANSGGGILNNDILNVTNTTLNSNNAENGGGIWNGALITVINSTLSGNTSILSGGGINNAVGTAKITNSTLSGNSAFSNGGGIYIEFGTVNLSNVIVANSTSGGDCSGSATSLGHNLDSDDTCGLTDPDDLPGVVPLLGPLEDNGGPTETHELLPGSPAIDAGGFVAAITDQRGVTRPPATDIGAFESQGNCTLILDVSYTAGIATIQATVGTWVPATENIWGTFQSNVLNLESTAIPVTDPPAKTLVFSGAVPAQGVVAAFATLTTPADGIICSDFKTVDTGLAP